VNRGIVVSLLLLAAAPSAAQSGRADGALSPADAHGAFNAFVGGASESGLATSKRDANCDGVVTPGDALAIYERYLLDLPAQPCFSRAVDVGQRACLPPQLHLRHRAFAPLPGSPARYEVDLEVEDASRFNAFGLRLTDPWEDLELVAVELGADTEHWIAIDGVERAPGEVIAGGFNTGPAAPTEPLQLMRFVFAVHARAVDGRRILVDGLSDDLAGAEVVSDAGTSEAAHPAPVSFGLHHGAASRPDQRAVIQLDVPAGRDRARLRLVVHDATGQLVRVLLDDTRTPGFYQVVWDGTNRSGIEVPSGVYYCRLQTYGLVESMRLVID
jgi:hypothetical protein